MTPAARLALFVGFLQACGGVAFSESARDGGASDARPAVVQAPSHTVDAAAAIPPSESEDAGVPDLFVEAGVDAGPQCAPLPGCTSTTSCPEGDGCHLCTCVAGSQGFQDLPGVTWLCPMWNECAPGAPWVADAGVCGATPPQEGTACDLVGLECEFGGCLAFTSICQAGAWANLSGPVCSPPPPTPTP